MSTLSSKRSYLILFAILLLSLGLNLYGNKFPLGYHIDEVVKVHFIQTDTQDFKHPILLLQVVRLVRLIIPVETDQQVVELGRITTAIFGTLIVYLTFYIAQRHLSRPYALAAACLTAVSPGIVMHSHYLKEDIAFTVAILLTFIFFFRFAEEIILMEGVNSRISALPIRQMAIMGLAIGLLVSAKYKSGIVLFCLFIAPVYIPGLRKLSYFKGLFGSLVIGFFTFLLINFPILIDHQIFFDGMLFELNHARTGHEGIFVTAMSQFFTFHLSKSLLPSITLLPIALAACYLLLSIWRWRQTDWRERFLIVFLVIFYVAIEISPLKPFPGYIRYVVPMLPIVAFLSMRAISQAADLFPDRAQITTILLVVAIAILFPFISSVRLVSALTEDTREQLDAALANKQEPIALEQYTGTSSGNSISLTSLDLSTGNPPFCTLVASSFKYDRFIFGSSLDGQAPDIYSNSQKYASLFEQPYEEIAPAYRSFSFSNPTLRVIELCPPLWSSAEYSRLSAFLQDLPGNQTDKLTLVSPSPSPLRPIETDRSISLASEARYPDFLIIPEHKPLFYAIDNAPIDPAYQPELIVPMTGGTFEMTDATSLTFLQTIGQTETSAQRLPENAIDWKNESGWTLLGYDRQQNSEQLEIVTYWRIEALPDGFAERYMTRFYQIFNSENQMLLNKGGAVGLWGYTVQVGDIVVERVAIPISAEWPEATYSLSIGLYDPIHNTNFFFESADRPASYTVDIEIK